MTLPRNDGEISAVYRPVSEVESLELVTSLAHARFVAPGSLTSGKFGLFRWDMSAGAGGAAPHFHKTFSESFYVLSGTVRFGNGERSVDTGEGDLMYVPERGIHEFRNDSDVTASMLILFAPGPPREEYFRELAEIMKTGRQLSAEEWTEFYARHDQYMV
jgi:mannose-6-phosphate isomerase-like protein (cupin superfamily)